MRNKVDPSASESQSTGNAGMLLLDMGWAFRAKIKGMKTRAHAARKSSIARYWSLEVSPGKASGIAVATRNTGDHAIGLSRGHASGLNLWRIHPKLPILGVELTHDSGGASSPDLKSGGVESSPFHHEGSPRSQCWSEPASMVVAGAMESCWLR